MNGQGEVGKEYVKMRISGKAFLDKMSAWGHIRTIYIYHSKLLCMYLFLFFGTMALCKTNQFPGHQTGR